MLKVELIEVDLYLPKNETVPQTETSIGHFFVQICAIQFQKVEKSESSNGTDFSVQVGILLHFGLEI